MRYFKGSCRKDGKRCIFKLYDKPQEDLFDVISKEEHPATYIIEASCIETTGITRYATEKECNEQYFVSREITEEEYNFYQDIQHLIEEMYQHDFTGGFPRRETVSTLAGRLRQRTTDALYAMEHSEY